MNEREIKLELKKIDKIKKEILEYGYIKNKYEFSDIIVGILYSDENLAIEIWKKLIEEFKDKLLTEEYIYRKIIEEIVNKICYKKGYEYYIELLNKYPEMKQVIYKYSFFSKNYNLLLNIFQCKRYKNDELFDDIMTIIVNSLDSHKLRMFFEKLATTYASNDISLDIIRKWIKDVSDITTRDFIEILYEFSPYNPICKIEQAQKVIDIFYKIGKEKMVTPDELSRLLILVIGYDVLLAKNCYEQFIGGDENNVYDLEEQEKVRFYLEILMKLPWTSHYMDNIIKMIRNSDIIIKIMYQFTYIERMQVDYLVRIINGNDSMLLKKCFACIKENKIANNKLLTKFNTKYVPIYNYSLEEIIREVKRRSPQITNELWNIINTENSKDIVAETIVYYNNLLEINETKNEKLDKLIYYFEKVLFIDDTENLIIKIFSYFLQVNIEYAIQCIEIINNAYLKNKGNEVLKYYYQLILNELSRGKYKEQLYFMCKNNSLVYKVAIQDKNIRYSLFDISYRNKDFEFANKVLNKVTNKQDKLFMLEGNINRINFESFTEQEKKYLFEWLELIDSKRKRYILIGCLINSNLYDEDSKKDIAFEISKELISSDPDVDEITVDALIELTYYIATFSPKQAIQNIYKLKTNNFFIIRLLKKFEKTNILVLYKLMNEDENLLEFIYNKNEKLIAKILLHLLCINDIEEFENMYNKTHIFMKRQEYDISNMLFSMFKYKDNKENINKHTLIELKKIINSQYLNTSDKEKINKKIDKMILERED